MSNATKKDSPEEMKRRRQERKLDRALRDSFPASDPIAMSEPAPARPKKETEAENTPGSAPRKAPKRPARR